MSLCESAGGASGAVGRGTDGCEVENCRWLKPVLVGQFEFVEWTTDKHLRHSRFVALRDDEKASNVREDP
jgi:ATP-dependent DNA ligase